MPHRLIFGRERELGETPAVRKGDRCERGGDVGQRAPPQGVRSLVPVLAKAARTRIGPDSSAAPVTSTMTQAVPGPCARAAAVHQLVEDPVGAIWPVTILQHHPHVTC